MKRRASIEVPIYMISLGRRVPARVYRLVEGDEEIYRISNTEHDFVAYVTAETATLPTWDLDPKELRKRLSFVSREQIEKLDLKKKTSITSAA